MLNDFLLLEMYFDQTQSAQYIEDVIRKYGRDPVRAAIRKGHLKLRTLMFGPEKGKTVCYLSEQGRNLAARLPSGEAA